MDYLYNYVFYMLIYSNIEKTGPRIRKLKLKLILIYVK